MNPSRDWFPTVPISSQSWSSSVDSELATVGSFDTGTDASLEDKQSFAVFSSVSCDSPEQLVPDTTLQDKNDPVFNQGSTLRNFTKPIQSIINSTQVNHFHSDQSPRCEQYNSHDECYHGKDDQSESTVYRSESQMIDVKSESKNQPRSASSSMNLSTEKNATYNPESETIKRKQPPYEVESCVHNNESVSETENASISTNDSAGAISDICTSSSRKENPSCPPFHVVKPKEELQVNNEHIKIDQVTKREPNMLSEILSFLDDANSHTPLARSPLLAINSETESNAEGGFRRPDCEGVTRLHGMSMTELTEEVLALQVSQL